MTEHDSTADTLRHALRVGELMGQPIRELVDRSVRHDRSKTEEPELSVFNEFTPKLRESTYGSDEYKEFLAAMGAGLEHHYAVNRHHPEHFDQGISGMTLVDLLEMLADWRAASERHADGSLDQGISGMTLVDLLEMPFLDQSPEEVLAAIDASRAKLSALSDELTTEARAFWQRWESP